jgi:hypothetical protein
MNKRLLFFSLIFLILVSERGAAQDQQKKTVTLSGKLLDKTGEALPSGNIRLLNTKKALIKGTLSDIDGNFSLQAPADSFYILLVSYVGYASIHYDVNTSGGDIHYGSITMKEDPKFLKEVEVKGVQTRGEQKGDSVQFNADAFKTHPDATAEDLVKKMPGITSDNSGIKVNGEAVQKILVDGKPFFGDDPNAALKNIPAEIIDKVEVFDKLTDQSAFTGFNDGNQQKTINLVTKKGKNAGQFGRIYGGAGADESGDLRYNAGAAINSFKDKQRVTLLLLGNNINQQNFSNADLSGAMSNSGQSSQQGGGGGRGNSGSSLMASGQNGITATQSAGLNYSDEWSKKMTVSGSYFFNNSQNTTASSIERNYFTDNRLLYKEGSTSSVNNTNHRLNFRFEYSIDSANKLIVVPSLSFQDNTLKSSILGSNFIGDNIRLSETNTNSKTGNVAADLSNFILFQHKMKKQGRTISFGLTTSKNNRDNNGNYYANNNYGDTVNRILDQQYGTSSNTSKVNGNLSYTEPLNKNGQLQISYQPSYTEAYSNKQTYDRDAATGGNDLFNAGLSNKYINVYQTQRAGLSYRYRKDKLNFSLGSDVQDSKLTGKQEYPKVFELSQSFQNILPNAMLNYRFSKTKNFRLFYRSNTNIPSITQLQDVLDISNPLQVKTGNSALKQTFENNLNLRFGGFDPKTSKNIMFFANGNYTDNYISNATYILRSDSVIQNNLVKAGSQLSKPVNLNNFYSARGFFVYGFPITTIKSNVNVNGGINYNHTPSLINYTLNYSNSYAVNGGAFVGSNISEKLDFSIGYNANYTIVKNTRNTGSNNSFVNQTGTVKLNWLFLNGFVLNTDLNTISYSGLNQSFNQHYTLWNASLGYKFTKGKALEAKVNVFDILNQNRSIGRTVTGAYTEDNYTTVLRRYLMFSLTYTIRNFKNGTPPKNEEEGNRFPGGPPPGMRPPGQ